MIFPILFADHEVAFDTSIEKVPGFVIRLCYVSLLPDVSNLFSILRPARAEQRTVHRDIGDRRQLAGIDVEDVQVVTPGGLLFLWAWGGA